MEKKTLKKNPSNRKPISCSTEFRLDGGEGRLLKCYIQTDPLTKRVVEELSLLTNVKCVVLFITFPLYFLFS